MLEVRGPVEVRGGRAMHSYAAAYWYVAPCLHALHGLPVPCALPYMPDPFQAYNVLQSALLTRRIGCISCLVPCQATSMTREGDKSDARGRQE